MYRRRESFLHIHTRSISNDPIGSYDGRNTGQSRANERDAEFGRSRRLGHEVKRRSYRCSEPGIDREIKKNICITETIPRQIIEEGFIADTA